MVFNAPKKVAIYDLTSWLIINYNDQVYFRWSHIYWSVTFRMVWELGDLSLPHSLSRWGKETPGVNLLQNLNKVMVEPRSVSSFLLQRPFYYTKLTRKGRIYFFHVQCSSLCELVLAHSTTQRDLMTQSTINVFKWPLHLSREKYI